MRFTSEHRLSDGVLERELTVGDVPGILWTPETASAPVPLILLGHPGGLRAMYPRLAARARLAAASGFASATIELPGGGDRPASTVTQPARADLHRALAAGSPVDDDIIDRLVLPLVDSTVPEWRTTLDALLSLPAIAGPVGYSGGVISIGVRLAVVEPRIVAAGLFAGSYVPRSIIEEARRVTIPVHVLLQWDDEGNDRRRSLELFDALGSQEKTLQANTGGHTGVPPFAGEDAARFFERHLTTPAVRRGGLHHLEIWRDDATDPAGPLAWLLSEVGYITDGTWPTGSSWRLGDAYVVLESGPHHRRGRQDRLASGMNHLALRAGGRADVEDLTARAQTHGWRLMFADRHPWAGGPEHYAAYLEDDAGFEVELVADDRT